MLGVHNLDLKIVARCMPRCRGLVGPDSADHLLEFPPWRFQYIRRPAILGEHHQTTERPVCTVHPYQTLSRAHKILEGLLSNPAQARSVVVEDDDVVRRQS